MVTESMNLESQTSELERLRFRCVSAQVAVNSVWRHMSQLTDQEAELTATMQTRYESELHAQLERTAQEVRDRLAHSE